MPTQWVYGFGAGKSEGRTGMKNLLGGKGHQSGWNGIFGVACASWFYDYHWSLPIFADHERNYPQELMAQAMHALAEIESKSELNSWCP